MQTFLPYADFRDCAIVLDYKRLANQRVEVKVILNSLISGGGWSNHPAVKMWAGYEYALKCYGNIMIDEFVARGGNNKMPYWTHGTVIMPPWMGDERVHLSHRRNLIRKDPKWYGDFWPDLEPLEGYYWPV